MRTAHRRAQGVVAATLGLVLPLLLVGCGGGVEGDGAKAASPEPRSIPLPREVQETGTITEPALEPQWLEESTGTEEPGEQAYHARSGVIVLDDVVVSYSRDIITAVDRETGESAWRSDLDMGGGQVCAITRPAPGAGHLTVTYGELGRCDGSARISTSDGTASETYPAGGDDPRSIATFAGVVDRGDTDYLVQTDGIVLAWGEDGTPTELARIRSEDQVETVAPTDGGDVLVVVTGSGGSARTVVHGLSLPDGEVLWTRALGDLVPRLGSELVSLHPQDGRYVFAQKGDICYLVTLDPATGDLVAQAHDDGVGNDVSSIPGDLSLDPVDLDNAPESIGRVGDDVVVNSTAFGLARISTSGKVRWTYVPEMDLREGTDQGRLTAGPVTPDGRQMLATLSNARSTDLLLLDTEDGSLLARWAVPEKYVAGFTTLPYVHLVGAEGVVLVRNQVFPVEAFQDGRDPRKPYDSGYFTFPEP